MIPWIPGTSFFLSVRSFWKRCEFGPHPRSLLVVDRAAVSSYDLRTRSDQSPINLLNARPNELISDIVRHPSDIYQVAIATNRRTLLIDTRYPKIPILEWNCTNHLETQQFIRFVKDSGSPYSTDMIYTWGRHYGEQLGYSYTKASSGKMAYSSSVQKYTSFFKHPIFNTMSYSYIPKMSYQEYFLEEQDIPPWPALFGSISIPHDENSSFTIFQLDENGNLFAQSLSYNSEDEINHQTVLDRIKNLEDQSLSSHIKILESQVSTIPDFEANHEVNDFSSLLDYCQEQIINCLENQSQQDIEIPSQVFDTIQSAYDAITSTSEAVHYGDSTSEFPFLDNVSHDVIRGTLKMAQIKCPENGKIEVRKTEAEILDMMDQLPASSTEFLEGTKDLAKSLLLKDLTMAHTVFIPSKSSIHVTENDGSLTGHASMVHSPLWQDIKEFNGVTSWLLEQWFNPAPFEKVQYESDYSSGQSARETDSEGLSISSRRPSCSMDGAASGSSAQVGSSIARPSSRQSSVKSGGVSASNIARLPSLASRIAVTQPELVIIASAKPSSARKTTSQPVKKRKMGF
jgi:hypothetical protein